MVNAIRPRHPAHENEHVQAAFATCTHQNVVNECRAISPSAIVGGMERYCLDSVAPTMRATCPASAWYPSALKCTASVLYHSPCDTDSV